MNLASCIDRHPDDDVALVSRGQPVTYGELRSAVAQLRGTLIRTGVSPGARVALVAANNRHFAVAYLAVLGVGGVVVPLNPTSPAGELERELKAVGAGTVIAGPTALEKVRGLDPAETGISEVLAADDPELFVGDPAPVVDRSPNDLACLIFTAGTGGAPKAAMLSHGNLLSNLEQVQRHAGRALTPTDVSFGVLPMFHIFGLNVVLGLSLFAGASVVLVERFDPVAAVETIERHAITVVAGAPPMFAALAAVDAPRESLRSVRLAVSGASPLPPEVADAFARRFGVEIHEGYGLTEASPIVTSSVVGGGARPGSIGVPLPGVEVRLVDAEGEDALMGDEGEIWVRGPNVFQGYWEEPEATRRVLTDDGWLRTGDIAVADEDGYLYIVDRAKDLIIVSGFNVYPAEVEEVLAEMPGIAAAGVAGVPHPYTGETVRAWVVAEEGARLDEDSIIEFCARRLARYKCPTKVTFVDELPRGLGGKLLRRDLA